MQTIYFKNKSGVCSLINASNLKNVRLPEGAEVITKKEHEDYNKERRSEHEKQRAEHEAKYRLQRSKDITELISLGFSLRAIVLLTGLGVVAEDEVKVVETLPTKPSKRNSKK